MTVNPYGTARGIVRKARAKLRGEQTGDFGISFRQMRRIIGRDDATILEIGAADGLDSVRFLTEFRDKRFRLFCFEPDLRNTATWLTNVSDPRATLIRMAVGEEVGEKTWYRSSTIYSSSIKRPNVQTIQSVWPDISFDDHTTVAVTTLDGFVFDPANEIDVIDFIWADVQGAEDLLIRGGLFALSTRTRFLYTEYSAAEYYVDEPNREQILQLLGPNWSIVKDFGTDILLRNNGL